MHLAFANFKLNKQAAKLYPWNTENNIALLEVETNLSDANDIADKINLQNAISYVPYVIKTNVAYASGDFNSLVMYNRQLITLNPFAEENYTNYAIMLINGIEKYKSVNDTESAAFCERELMNVISSLNSLPQRVSPLGKMIKDQPEIELSSEITSYIARLEE